MELISDRLSCVSLESFPGLGISCVGGKVMDHMQYTPGRLARAAVTETSCELSRDNVGLLWQYQKAKGIPPPTLFKKWLKKINFEVFVIIVQYLTLSLSSFIVNQTVLCCGGGVQGGQSCWLKNGLYLSRTFFSPQLCDFLTSFTGAKRQEAFLWKWTLGSVRFPKPCVFSNWLNHLFLK